MIYNLEKLEAFLRENEIPQIKKKPLTFLGISKQPHYENVISNIYAFFFDVNGEHGLNDLFVNSLSEIIHEKTKNQKDQDETENQFYNFRDFEIETEFPTDIGGRIDILLYNDDYAIIIENKIYHHLNNNLDDYWDSINVSLLKVGIVLSLGTLNNIDHEKYINITHKDLLGRVFKKLGVYLLDANEKHVVFLKDFYQNIMNMSGSKTEEKDFLFFYQNQNDITQLVKLQEQVFKHIGDETYRSLIDRNDLNFSRPNKSSGNYNKLKYFISKKHPDLMFTLFFDQLLTNEKTLKIVIELQGKAKQLLVKEDKYSKINVSDKAKNLINKTNLSSEHHWVHFASREYKLNEEEIYTLGSAISNIIEDDGYNELFKGVEEYLTEVRVENKSVDQ